MARNVFELSTDSSRSTSFYLRHECTALNGNLPHLAKIGQLFQCHDSSKVSDWRKPCVNTVYNTGGWLHPKYVNIGFKYGSVGELRLMEGCMKTILKINVCFSAADDLTPSVRFSYIFLFWCSYLLTTDEPHTEQLIEGLPQPPKQPPCLDKLALHSLESENVCNGMLCASPLAPVALFELPNHPCEQTFQRKRPQNGNAFSQPYGETCTSQSMSQETRPMWNGEPFLRPSCSRIGTLKRQQQQL